MGEKLRVVLDTNVWISIALDRALAKEFPPLIQEGKIEVCLSRALVRELARVLGYPRIAITLEKAGVSPVVALSRVVRSVTMVRTWRTVREIEEDTADNRVLECALYAKADFIVSGDKHLLLLGQFKGIKILSPREFLQMIEDQRRV
jgi:uncharacterized protein